MSIFTLQKGAGTQITYSLIMYSTHFFLLLKKVLVHRTGAYRHKNSPDCIYSSIYLYSAS